MLKPRVLFLTFFLICALALAACGAKPSGSAAAPTQAPAANAPAATEAPTTAPAATEATAATAAPAANTSNGAASLVIWADNLRAPVLKSLSADFEKQYGLKIDVTEKPFDKIRDDFKVAAPTGQGPDIIIGAHDWLGELVENGLLAEVNLGDKADQFLPGAVQAFTYDGKLYGMPYATENVAFVYNPKLVTTVPKTWDDVKNESKAIVDSGKAPQGYIIQENDPYHFFPIQTSFGGYVFGLTSNGYDPKDVGIDSSGTISAAAWLDSMYKAGLLKPGSAVTSDIMQGAFTSGKAAMMITGPWALPALRESGIPFSVTVLPGETKAAQPFVGVQGFMISSFSKNQLLAQTFLQEFVATPETMEAIFKADPRPSAFLSVRSTITDTDIAAFAKAGEQGLPMPAIPEMSAVWTSWGNAMQLVSQQAEDPNKAFTDAAKQIRDAIAKK